MTTLNLSIRAEQLYPFLFTVLALYYVGVSHVKLIVSNTNKTIMYKLKSRFTHIRQKYKITKREGNKKQALDFAFYCWNASLSIFSLMGAMHLFPEIMRKMRENTYRDYWCESVYNYDSITQEWIAYFHLSKLVELGDTFFLVLRGKDPTFLHMYHHITVAIISWESMVQLPSLILTGVFINYFIHFIMYLYFALHIYDKVPAWFCSKWITYMQIGQMAIGIFGSMESYYYAIQYQNHVYSENICVDYTFEDTCRNISLYQAIYTEDTMEIYKEPCNSSPEFILIGIFLYASYLVLFVNFYNKKTANNA